MGERRLVHLVVVEGSRVRPLCGEWGDSKNGTKERAVVVSCPACRALLSRLGTANRPEARVIG